MDMSFANQALCAEYMLGEGRKLAPDCYKVPKEIDDNIARLKLEALGVRIDTLADEQQEYLSSWNMGTE